MISSLTTSVTALLCNPSSVNLEGGSSYVHLDENIEWDSPGVIPRVFPLVLDTQLLWLLDFALSHVTKDGSTLRGTRASLIASDVESG